MKKTLSEAKKIESELYTMLVNSSELLDIIHCSGAENLDRDELWLIRARVQDAVRAMNDLQVLRKNLPFV